MLAVTRYEKFLALLFIVTIPLINPWVRGDGVGYYAFARSILIEHSLNFKKDWLNANASFRMGRTDAQGKILPGEYTATGHLDNHFSIGPAALWFPFLIAAHAGVLLADRLGASIAANGFSRPYVIAMGFATALYGFLALWISFLVAREYVPDRWAFLATLGIWFGSSLPVYMYFNPSWSHAQSAFMVAIFVWYWDRTRDSRGLRQWAILGALGGLMMDVYYVTIALFVLPLAGGMPLFHHSTQTERAEPLPRLLLGYLLFGAAAVLFFFPTLLAKKIIYGSYFDFGYRAQWYWSSPALGRVAFSAEHGLFSWTPLLLLAIAGLFLLARRNRSVALSFLAVFVVYLYIIGCYSDWSGLSSFGNRFFVSLTPLFVIGLAGFFDWLAHAWTLHRATIFAPALTLIFVAWNLGLMFQWGMHLIPVRGPISFRDAVYNQVEIVPGDAAHALVSYFTRRRQLMGRIETEDVRQLKSVAPPDSQSDCNGDAHHDHRSQ